MYVSYFELIIILQKYYEVLIICSQWIYSCMYEELVLDGAEKSLSCVYNAIYEGKLWKLGMELLVAFIENGTQETAENAKINIRKIKLYRYMFSAH